VNVKDPRRWHRTTDTDVPHWGVVGGLMAVSIKNGEAYEFLSACGVPALTHDTTGTMAPPSDACPKCVEVFRATAIDAESAPDEQVTVEPSAERASALPVLRTRRSSSVVFVRLRADALVDGVPVRESQRVVHVVTRMEWDAAHTAPCHEDLLVSKPVPVMASPPGVTAWCAARLSIHVVEISIELAGAPCGDCIRKLLETE
jgi:hypothetical protein